MAEIVLCSWGFRLSWKAVNLFLEKKRGQKDYRFSKKREGGHLVPEPERDDPDLVAVVKELGEKAGFTRYGSRSELRIVSIPDGINWVIEVKDDDSWEFVFEKGHVWGLEA